MLTAAVIGLALFAVLAAGVLALVEARPAAAGAALCALGVLALAGCGSTKTIISRTTVTVEQRTQTFTVSAVGPGSSGRIDKTLAQFAAEPLAVRRQVVVSYLTTHPDSCYGRKPTPRNVAENIAPSIANFRPGYDAADGTNVPGSAPIGEAIKHAEANIGC